MSTILLSIKPQYAKVILEGKKKYEFRKNRPTRSVNKIIIYASSPQNEIVGEAEIEEILEDTPSKIWEIAKNSAGITSSFYFSYYKGKKKAIAYKLKNVVIYNETKTLLEYGIEHAPQSFVYINMPNNSSF